MPLGYDFLYTDLHKPSKMINHRPLKWLELYFCLLLSVKHSSQSQWYAFWNSDTPTSQSPKQSSTEETNGQNNNDKAKKPSAAIQFRKVLQYLCVLYVHAIAILVSCPPQHHSIHIKYIQCLRCRMTILRCSNEWCRTKECTSSCNHQQTNYI